MMTITGQDWSDMDEGWLYGEWETGPWWAFHDKVFSNILIAIFRPPENERESWSIEQKQEKESCSYLRVKENLDPLKKNRKKRAVITVGWVWGSGCAAPRSSGGTPAFSSTSYGCINLIRELFLNIVLQGVPKKKLRIRFQKNWSPNIALKIL